MTKRELDVAFEPSCEFEKIQLTLRDNSSRSPEIFQKLLLDNNFYAARGLVHLVVGYDPKNRGSRLNRGCGNNCLTCFFEQDYFENLPTHINEVKPTNPETMLDDLRQMQGTAQAKTESIIKIKLSPKDTFIRITGDVRGDPVMADFEATKKLVRRIRQGFPQATILIDTTANQYTIPVSVWSQLKDTGVNRIMVSVNSVASEAGYMTFHGVNQGALKTAITNIRNIDQAGIKIGLSYVWGNHPDLSAEVKEQMPAYICDGKSPEARANFIQNLNLSQTPIERLWLLETSSEEIWQRIKDGDQRYQNLLNQGYQGIPF